MLNFRASLSAVLVLGLMATGELPVQAQSYSQMVVFGDSLSDTGNLFALSGGLFPPPSAYYQGRYSNGPLWVEFLAPRLGITYNQATNFALAGAGSGRDHVVSFLPGMQQQVEAFAAANPVADPDALYIVWAGANDYLAIGNTSPTLPSENIGTAISNLAALGAKNFLIPNLPDLGILPGTRDTPEGTLATALSRQHNHNLDAKLDVLRGQLPQTEIDLFDVETLFDQVFANPAAFGLRNVTIPAYLTALPSTDGFLFWDEVHPAIDGHRLLGQYGFAALNSVPEPGISALMAGIAVFGGMALRRNRRRGKRDGI